MGANQPGMQADMTLEQDAAAAAEQVWLQARDASVAAAEQLADLNVHKQVTNRLLEPWMWHTVLITATNWHGFFWQRVHRDAQPEIREAATAMKVAYDASIPALLTDGEWHLPYVSDDELDTVGLDAARKVSAARCARTSYTTVHGNRDLSEDLGLYDRLVTHRDQDPPHASPLEHVCTPDPDNVATVDVKDLDGNPTGNLLTVPLLGNLVGFRQMRHAVLTW